MEFEYLWLLVLPLFFGLGWIAARIDIRDIVSQSRHLPDSYFKGLNFLLNQQPDKAIEAFSEAAKVDTETVELHFTLGGLFRRRGEVDRAIRLHQTLVDRPDLGREQRLAAQFELGQDFLKAGLLDRAEHVFRELQDTSYAELALRFLMEIYVQEKEWQQAIAIAERLAAQSTHPYQVEIAHFHCEMASAHAVADKLDLARAEIARALEINRRCVRANLLLGEFEAAAGRHEAALEIWRRIESQDPRYLPLVAGKLFVSCKVLDMGATCQALLQDWMEKYPSVDLLNVVYQSVMELEGAAAAQTQMRAQLRRHPSLQGLEKLFEAQLADAVAEARPDIQAMKDLVRRHGERLAYFQCEHCGFKARQFFWHCPACTAWESFPPRRLGEVQA